MSDTPERQIAEYVAIGQDKRASEMSEGDLLAAASKPVPRWETGLMGAQRMSDKKVKQWAAKLNLPIIRMWAHGGYTHAFVTDDHRHGWVDTKTGEVGWDEDNGDRQVHYSSCSELFPGDPRSPHQFAWDPATKTYRTALIDGDDDCSCAHAQWYCPLHGGARNDGGASR